MHKLSIFLFSMGLDNIRKNYLDLKSKIKAVCQRCGRDENEIKIVAVSKTFPAEYILELFGSGHKDFGENRVQELIKKKDEIRNVPINWHLVGHLQTNKVKYISNFVYLIHSVDSFKLAEEIDKYAKKNNRIIDVLVQVNTSNEPQKSGIEPEKTPRLCREISSLENIRLCGLMTLAQLTSDTKIIRENFRTLKNLYDELKEKHSDFKYISMGMTSDFEIAIEEGSNMLRIGSAIFGAREYY